MDSYFLSHIFRYWSFSGRYSLFRFRLLDWYYAWLPFSFTLHVFRPYQSSPLYYGRWWRLRWWHYNMPSLAAANKICFLLPPYRLSLHHSPRLWLYRTSCSGIAAIRHHCRPTALPQAFDELAQMMTSKNYFRLFWWPPTTVGWEVSFLFLV